MIHDGASLGEALHGVVDDPRTYLVRFGYDPPCSEPVADVPPLDAEINHGRWIWRCPCSADDAIPYGGGVVFVETPIGWCARCRNASVGGQWRPLRLPPEREQIEAVLVLRPDAETRNWWPGETLDMLTEQNAAHGVAGER